jgi:hypothetical protein
VSSIDSIVAAFQRCVDSLQRAAEYARDAADRAADGRELGEAVGVHRVVERFEQVVVSAEQLEAMLGTGIAMAGEAITRVEAVRGGTSARQAIGAAARSDQPVPPATDLPLPVTVQRTGRALPPRQEGDPTSGVALIGDEAVHLRSGRDASLVADLHPALANYVAMTDHVESHLAARMRREGIREASLVINNQVCEGRFSCDRLLPDILPVEARLTLYERVGGVLRLRQVYVGTGRGIV